MLDRDLATIYRVPRVMDIAILLLSQLRRLMFVVSPRRHSLLRGLMFGVSQRRHSLSRGSALGVCFSPIPLGSPLGIPLQQRLTLVRFVDGTRDNLSPASNRLWLFNFDTLPAQIAP